MGAGSQDRPALSEDRVSEIIREEVIDIVRGQFLEMFGSIKTVMVEYFDEPIRDGCRGRFSSSNDRGRSWLSFPVPGLVIGTYCD